MDIEVNYLALLLAGVAYMIVGFLWYGFLFAKPWMKLMGMKEQNMKDSQGEMARTYAISFVFALVTAFVLSHVMMLSQEFYGYARLQTGVTTAFWMWVGFIMPVQLTEVFFGGKKFKLFAINTGYQLVAVLTMGAAIALL